jgi:hypothetical protein
MNNSLERQWQHNSSKTVSEIPGALQVATKSSASSSQPIGPTTVAPASSRTAHSAWCNQIVILDHQNATPGQQHRFPVFDGHEAPDKACATRRLASGYSM